MDNQHRKIQGYRELSQEEIDLMNLIKQQGDELGATIKKLEDMQKKESEFTYNAVNDPELAAKADALIEAKRWTAIGKTDLQKGIMALVRAVARPSSF